MGKKITSKELRFLSDFFHKEKEIGASTVSLFKHLDLFIKCFVLPNFHKLKTGTEKDTLILFSRFFDVDYFQYLDAIYYKYTGTEIVGEKKVTWFESVHSMWITADFLTNYSKSKITYTMTLHEIEDEFRNLVESGNRVRDHEHISKAILDYQPIDFRSVKLVYDKKSKYLCPFCNKEKDSIHDLVSHLMSKKLLFSGKAPSKTKKYFVQDYTKYVMLRFLEKDRSNFSLSQISDELRVITNGYKESNISTVITVNDYIKPDKIKDTNSKWGWNERRIPGSAFSNQR